MQVQTLRLFLGSAVLAVPWPTQAIEIFRWVDANGVVHISDTRPDDEIEVTEIEIDARAETIYDAAADPYSVMNQTKRIHDRWVEILAASRATAELDGATHRRTEFRQTVQPKAKIRSFYPTTGPTPYPPYPPSNLAREQVRALQQLDLLGPRPASINSEAHRDRVARSRALPLIVEPAAGPR